MYLFNVASSNPVNEQTIRIQYPLVPGNQSFAECHQHGRPGRIHQSGALI